MNDVLIRYRKEALDHRQHAPTRSPKRRSRQNLARIPGADWADAWSRLGDFCCSPPASRWAHRTTTRSSNDVMATAEQQT